MPGDDLPEIIEPGDIGQRALSVRSETQFLAHLVLARGDVLRGLDRQPGIVAVIGRVPVPEAPGADRGERRAAQMPVERSGDTALVGVHAQPGIDIGQPIVRVGTGRHIVCRRSQRGILPRCAAQAGADAQIDLGAAIPAKAGVIGHDAQLHAGRGREQQLAAQGLVVDAVLVCPGVHVVDHAITPRQQARKPIGQHAIDQRPGGHGLGLHQPALAHAHLLARPRGERGQARGDGDGAGRGVLAEQRALWPAQDFDPLHIAKVERRRRRPRMIDAIDIEPHAGFQPVVGLADRHHARSQAADGEGRVARVRRGIGQRRHQRGECLGVDRQRPIEPRAIDHAERGRHGLRRFGALARRHDDIARRAQGIRARGRNAGGIGRISLGRACQAKAGCQRQAAGHSPPPPAIDHVLHGMSCPCTDGLHGKPS